MISRLNIIAIISIMLMSLNYLIAYSNNIAPVYHHIYNIVFVLIILQARLKYDEKMYDYAIIYILVTIQYGSDPYDTGFFQLNSGIYKYIIIIIIASSFRKISSIVLYPFILFLLATIFQVLFGDYFRYKHLVSDIVTVGMFLLLIGLHDNRIKVNISQIKLLLYKISCLLPILYFVALVSGNYHILYNSYVFIYGHAIYFLIIYGIVFHIYSSHHRSLFIYNFMVLLNILYFVQSAQSGYFVAIVLFLVIYIVANKRYSYLIYLGIMLLLLYNINLLSADGSWVKLKTDQFLSLIHLIRLDIEILPNSVAIRVAQFLNIYSQNGIIVNLAGNGLGSVYHDYYGNLNALYLHDKTYPFDQLISGEYHLIHETLVKVFMMGGLAGVMLYIYSILQIYKNITILNSLVMSFTILLFMTNVQMMMLMLVLNLLFSRESENKI